MKKYQEVTSDIAPKEQFWVKMAEVNFLFSKVDLHVSCLNLKCWVYIMIHLCLRWEIVSVHQVWMSSNIFFKFNFEYWCSKTTCKSYTYNYKHPYAEGIWADSIRECIYDWKPHVRLCAVFIKTITHREYIVVN